MVADPLGQRLSEVSTGAVVGQDLVTARLLHGRGQCPRTADLGLERTGMPLRLLLDLVEVLGQQRPRPAVVDARGVGEAPPGGLEVGAETGDHGEPAAGHRRPCATSGQLRDVREGELAEHDAHRLGVLPVVGAGHRPDTAGEGAHASASERAVGADGRRADDPAAVVDHGGLAGGDALGRVEELDGDAVATVLDGHDGAVLGAVGAQLDGDAGTREQGGDGAAPARPDAGDPVDPQALAGTDGDRAGDRLDVQHEARPAVRGRAADPQARDAGRSCRRRCPRAARAPPPRRRRRCRRRCWGCGRRACRAASRRCRRRPRSRCRASPACRPRAARAGRPPRAPAACWCRRAGRASAPAAAGRGRRGRRTGPCRGRPHGAAR